MADETGDVVASVPRPRFASIYTDGDDQTEAVRIHDFVYQSHGATCAYLVATPAGNVLVNTGLPHEAHRHKRLFAAAAPGPITHIVITQGHFDHIGGVNVLREPATEIVAHRDFGKLQDYQKRFAGFRMPRNLVFFAPLIHKAIESLSAAAERNETHPSLDVTPTVLVDDHHAFEVGGVRFELHAVPGGETTDSVVVWLPQHRIAFISTMLGPLFPHFPNLVTLRGDFMRSALDYLDSLARLRALEPELLVTGHYQPIRGREAIARALADLRDAVRHVHDATVDGMNEGKDVHTLMREVTLPPHVNVGQGYGKVSWSVRAIWEHYQGWFHYDSTTSLYPVPARALHGELAALAGGAKALVAAAERHLDADRPVEALHLLEIALAGEPADVGALRASLRAHECLLVKSGGENFWEWGWLTHQLREIRAALDAARGAAS
ncbi:MAG: MBL fold metallo-hydrolase [Deltaproteobacteria bacterium]|nr:MBL fold metallo-hydrolase [Deltaproteobacteria bacterium]